MSLIPKVMTKLPETGDLDTPGRGGSDVAGPGGQPGASGSPAENLGQRGVGWPESDWQGNTQKNAPEKKPRFVLMAHPPAAFPKSCLEGTRWWQDTWRPLEEESEDTAGQMLRYMSVQTYPGRDANDYRPIAPEMCLLFTDQAEYYVVCPDCRCTYGHMQWSGSTRAGREWRRDAEDDRQRHQRTKGWCEFCDPVFGNGGWSLR